MLCEICQKTYSSELFSNILAGNISGLFSTSFIQFERSNSLSVFALSLVLVIYTHMCLGVWPVWARVKCVWCVHLRLVRLEWLQHGYD